MWSLFSRQTIAESGILDGMTDYHSHILPGVDDGIQTFEKALEILTLYEELGIRKVWLTPHIMEDYPNRTNGLRERFNELSAYYIRSSKAPVTLFLASENMIDSLFMHRLNKDDLLPIIDSQHLLVETSYYIPPFNLIKLLEQIIYKGYTPILAHPERYYYLSNIHEYEDFCSVGVRLQLDLASIVGVYGEDVRRKALTLIQKGYYSLVGTDIHDHKSFVEWINIPVKKKILKSLSCLTNGK